MSPPGGSLKSEWHDLLGPFPTVAEMWKLLPSLGLKDLEEQRPLVTGDGHAT